MQRLWKDELKGEALKPEEAAGRLKKMLKGKLEMFARCTVYAHSEYDEQWAYYNQKLEWPGEFPDPEPPECGEKEKNISLISIEIKPFKHDDIITVVHLSEEVFNDTPETVAIYIMTAVFKAIDGLIKSERRGKH